MARGVIGRDVDREVRAERERPDLVLEHCRVFLARLDLAQIAHHGKPRRDALEVEKDAPDTIWRRGDMNGPRDVLEHGPSQYPIQYEGDTRSIDTRTIGLATRGFFLFIKECVQMSEMTPATAKETQRPSFWGRGAYELFIESEGIPIHTGADVPDLR